MRLMGWCLAALVGLGGPAEAQAKKLALLVGIGNYRHVKDLNAPPDDVNVMANLLVTRFGFAEADIKRLVDKDATKQGIVDAFRTHLGPAGPADTVVFYFSGHGSRTKDRDGDEKKDDQDETLVTWDSGRKGNKPNRDLTDDELRTLLGELKAKHIAVILDSCHSGSGTRGDGLARLESDDDRPVQRIKGLKVAPPPTPDDEDFIGDTSVVAIYAARSTQLAYEHEYDGQWVGALTYHLDRTLRDHSDGLTYRELMYAVREGVRGDFGAQHPEVEGPLMDNLVLEQKVAPVGLIPITPVRGRIVTVHAGQVHLMTPGTKLDVYPPDSEGTDPNERVGRIELKRVEAASSRGRMTEGSALTSLGYRARVVERLHPLFTLKIAIDADKTTVGDFEARLKEYDNLAMDDDSPLVFVEVDRKGIRGVDGSGKQLFGPIANTPDGRFEAVRELRRWATWHEFRHLGSAASKLDVKFELQDPTQAGRPGEFGLVFGTGAQFDVVATNHTPTTLYLTVLNLTDRGKIAVVYPTKFQDDVQVAPGESVRFPFETFLAPDVDRVVDELHLVATTEPVDFRPIEQAGPSRGTSGRSPLEALLTGAMEGTRTETDTVNAGTWTVKVITFETER